MSQVPSKPKVLLLDDEEDMLDFVSRVLRQDYIVERCSDSNEALRRLREGHYDLLITDEKMPKLSGLQMLEQLGEEKPNLIRVLLSGFSELSKIKQAKDKRRIHNYVVKPVDSESLLNAIEEAYAIAEGKSWGISPQ